MATNGKLLVVNIKFMKFLQMWPDKSSSEPKIWQHIKEISSLFQIFCGLCCILADFIIQIQGKYDDILDITENLIAMGPVAGSIYVGICFILNKDKVRKLIKNLVIFEEFGAAEKMLETERKAALFTKVFIFYAIAGNLIYLAMPYANISACRKQRQNSVYSKKMPCELMTRWRLPIPYEDRWYLHILVGEQLVLCLLTSFVTLAITMFIVSLLMQVITQLKQLREYIRNDHPIRDCIRYHIAIIEYSATLTQAFNSTVLMYISVTSYEISVLLFDVLMTNSVTDSLRYGLHLCGWLVLLFLPCYYGQKLIDESTKIGWEAYNIAWYDKSTSEQKDLRMMIMRSQKPLIVSAASLGVMSLETFLGVLSTAYSYFTLLVQMKQE